MANDRFFSNFEIVESQNDYTEEPFNTSKNSHKYLLFLPYSMIILCTKHECLQLT